MSLSDEEAAELERLRTRVEILEKANRAVLADLAELYFELRSPLRRAAMSNDEILREGFDPRTEEARLLLARQRREIVRSHTLLEEARLAQALYLPDLERKRVSVSDLAQGIADALGYERATDGLLVGHVGVDEGMEANAEPSLLRLALTLAMRSALHATPPGGAVHVGKRTDGALFLADEGEQGVVRFEWAMEPFLRIDPRPTIPDADLKLHTVRRIVERHGGKLWAEARPYGGMALLFTLE